MQIGKQLQQRRKEQGMSQELLAEKLHISRQSISKWENGSSLPSFANVVAISELFDLSLDDTHQTKTKQQGSLFLHLSALPLFHSLGTVTHFSLGATASLTLPEILVLLQGRVRTMCI